MKYSRHAAIGTGEMTHVDLKATVNLPKTDFPMKANLPQNEPKMLARWEQMRLYEMIRKARKGQPVYILHDGPPYANGAIHLGHALNKCLKDFVVKSQHHGWVRLALRTRLGLPWPAHRDQGGRDRSAARSCNGPAAGARGVPQVRREISRTCSAISSSASASSADFDHPYSTMTPQYEARVMENFYAFFEQGMVYKGLKPVYWCIHDETALAEAEVEYENHTSPSIWVRYALTQRPGGD